MALLPKIGTGTLVAPEQIMLMHKPKKPARHQTLTESPQRESQEVIVFKKKGTRKKNKEWWKDPSEVAQSVERRTKRRRKMADENGDENAPTGRIPRASGPHRTSTKLDVNIKSPVPTSQTLTNGISDAERRVRFEVSFASSVDTRIKPNQQLHTKEIRNLNAKTINPSSSHIGKVHSILQNDLTDPDPPERQGGPEVSPSNDPAVQPTQGSRTVQARVKAARQRARIWAETCSDPGEGNNNNNNNNNYNVKAIQSDAVLKGRPNEPRRGRTFNELAKPKQTHEPADKPVGGDKAPERGKRLPPPPKKEINASGPDQRPVNSAPAKEQPPLMNGPVPKVNTLVPRNDVPEKQPTPRQDRVVPPRQTDTQPGTSGGSVFLTASDERSKPSPRHDKTSEERPKRVEDAPRPSPKATAVVRPTHVKPQRKLDDHLEDKDEEKSARTPRSSRLPPDDHGPAYPQNHRLVSPPPPDPKTQEQDENFKYFASERPPPGTRDPPTQKVPPLHALSEKSEKSFATQKTKSVAAKSRSRSRSRSPVKSQRSKTVDLSKSPSTQMSEPSKKRREVTIIDARDLPKEAREPFMDEFAYGHERHKEFNEMDDEEKIEYFKDTLKMRPEQIRELTFHPKVNEPKTIHSTYTGVDALNWKAPTSARGKSARRQKTIGSKVYKKVTTVEPYKRKSFMLSRLQGNIYRHINSVYGNSPRDNRERHFFQKLATVQMEDYRKRYNQLAENEKRWLESTYRQKKQLRHVRKKFEDDAWRRFMTQYVTSKVLESEYKDREEFGLPNDVRELDNRSPNKRVPMTLTPNSRARQNQKRYGKMFKYNVGPQPQKDEKLKFEGYDSVYVDTEDEQGKPAKRRQTVAEIMREAKKILNRSDDSEEDDSPSPAVQKKQRRPTRYHERKEGSERYERPQAHRSRGGRYSEGARTPSHRSKSRPKSKARPPPKTMKELMDRKKKDAPQVGGRYKASNFDSIKKNLIKDSAMLDKSMKNKTAKTRKDPIDQVAESNDMSETEKPNRPEPKPEPEPEPEPKPQPDRIVTNQEREPEPDTKPAVITSVTKSTSETITERVIENGKDISDEKDPIMPSKNTVDYLDHTETQMGIETARQQKEIEKTRKEIHPKKTSAHPSTNSKSPERKRGTESQSLNAEVASLTSKASKQIQNERKQDSRRESQASRASKQVQNNERSQIITRRESQVSRAQSRVSVESKKPSETNGDTKLYRAPSRVSIISKQAGSIYRDNQVPRAPSRVSRAPSRATQQSVYDRFENKEVNRKNSVITQQSANIISTQNGRASRASVVKPTNGETPVKNGTGRVSRTSNMISARGSQTSASNQPENKQQPYRNVNGDVNGAVNAKSPESQKTVKTISPIQNGYSTSPIRSVNRETNGPVIKRDVHVDDVVNEVILKKSTNTRTGRPAAARQQKSKPEARSKASKHRVIRARSPRARGHEDTRISLDEFEREAQSRPARTRKRSTSRGRRGRSTSKSRKRSVSRTRERKRSVSRERRAPAKQKSYSRFPDIDRNGRMSSLSNGESKTRRNVHVREDVSERILTPPETEPKQWKNLVQKYLRQPSPKVGKTDDRALLETTLDTDEEDDVDIFERAKKRYLLDSDEESVY